jgi:hypothetical protein
LLLIEVKLYEKKKKKTSAEKRTWLQGKQIQWQNVMQTNLDTLS